MVDASVQTTDDRFKSDFEDIANTQKSGHGDWATGFDLLPVAGGESKRNHIFLAMFVPLAEFFYSASKCFEEFGVVHHTEVFTVARAEAPRAD